MPVLGNEPAVMNLTVHPGAVRGPDGDAVHFDVLHGAAALAGVVGVVSLTEARSATLIGVFISSRPFRRHPTLACHWHSAPGARPGALWYLAVKVTSFG
jgi:hypothetical protein